MKEAHGWKEPMSLNSKLHNLKKGPYLKRCTNKWKSKLKLQITVTQEIKEYNLVKTVYDGINFPPSEVKKV